MSTRKNMTLKVLWNRYVKKCRDSEVKFYSYRQFCENYAKWCEENKESLHFNAVIGQKMEVDFAGKTFHMVDSLTGEVIEIVVFVAVLPYSQYIYAEGMVSTKEPQWIAVNNNVAAPQKCFFDQPCGLPCRPSSAALPFSCMTRIRGFWF